MKLGVSHPCAALLVALEAFGRVELVDLPPGRAPVARGGVLGAPEDVGGAGRLAGDDGLHGADDEGLEGDGDGRPKVVAGARVVLAEGDDLDPLVVAVDGRSLEDVDEANGPLMVIPGTHRGPVLDHTSNGVFAGAINPDDPAFDREKIVTLTGKAGSMTVHHARLLHGSAPNRSDRARMILFYECASADAWPILGSNSYFHALGQRKFWDDLQDRTITGTPCLTPRLEQVPVTMPLPPAPDTGSIFRTQESAGARSAFAED